MKYLKPLKMIKDFFNKDHVYDYEIFNAIDKIDNPDNLEKIISVIGKSDYKKAYDFFSRISKSIQNIDFDYIKDRFIDIEDKYDHEILLKFCLTGSKNVHEGGGACGTIELIESTDPNMIMRPYLRRCALRDPHIDFKFGILVSISTKTENNLINWKECSDDIMKFYESIKSVIDYSHIESIDEVNGYSCRYIIYLNF